MAYGPPMAMGAPAPMGPPMGQPMAPPMEDPAAAGVGMDQAQSSPDEMMGVLLDAVVNKWGSAESMVSMEKQMLVDTLMQIAMPQPQMGPADFAEPGMGAGPMPPMQPQAGDMGMIY